MDQVGFGQNEREDGQVDEIGAGTGCRGVSGDLHRLLRREHGQVCHSIAVRLAVPHADVASGKVQLGGLERMEPAMAMVVTGTQCVR